MKSRPVGAESFHTNWRIDKQIDRQKVRCKYSPFAVLRTLLKETISFFTSACPSSFAWNSSAPTGWIFMKFDVWGFFFLENLSTKVQVSLKSDKTNGTLLKTAAHSWQYLVKFFIVWEIFQIKFADKIKTILCSKFSPKIVLLIKVENKVQTVAPQKICNLHAR